MHLLAALVLILQSLPQPAALSKRADGAATLAYLERLTELQDSFDQGQVKAKALIEGPKLLEATSRKLESATALAAEGVDPELTAFNQEFHNFIQDAATVARNEYPDMDAARKDDQNAMFRAAWKGPAAVSAVMRAKPHTSAEQRRYAGVMLSLWEKALTFQERWSRLQRQLPERYPDQRTELREQLGPALYVPEDASLFEADFPPKGEPSAAATEAFITGALVLEKVPSLEYWAYLFRSDTEDARRSLRFDTRRLRDLATAGVLPSAMEAAGRMVQDMAFVYSMVSLENAAVQWGTDVAVDDLPYLPSLTLVVKPLEGRNVRVITFEELKAYYLPVAQQTLNSWQRAIRDVVEKDPTSTERLRQVFEARFKSKLKL